MNSNRIIIVINIMILFLLSNLFFSSGLFWGGKLAQEVNEIELEKDIMEIEEELGMNKELQEDEKEQYVSELLEGERRYVIVNDTPDRKGNGDCNLDFCVKKESEFSYVVSVYRMDTDEKIYQSGLIIPGYKVETCKISLPTTSEYYPCNVLFEAYMRDGEHKVGAFAQQIMIHVERTE